MSVAAMLRSDPEKALPVVLGRVVPAGLRGLLVAGLVAAAMSTFDSTVNAGAAYWVKDIFQRYLRPQADEKTLVRQGRLATLVLTALAFVVALGVHNIDSIWSWITGPLSAGLFAPIVLRWYWWRFNGFGFALATAMGLLASVGLRVLAPDWPLWLAFPLTWSLSLIAGVVATLLSLAPSDDVLKGFFVKVRPFGWWRPVRKMLEDQPDLVRAARAEWRRDIPTAVLATIWHLSGVVAVISLILHKYDTMGWALGAFTLLGVGLYFAWYRKLEEN
jgi:Na+/proline symporter